MNQLSYYDEFTPYNVFVGDLKNQIANAFKRHKISADYPKIEELSFQGLYFDEDLQKFEFQSALGMAVISQRKNGRDVIEKYGFTIKENLKISCFFVS